MMMKSPHKRTSRMAYVCRALYKFYSPMSEHQKIGCIHILLLHTQLVIQQASVSEALLLGLCAYGPIGLLQVESLT